MSQIMMYILPLILGRTFDLNRMQVGFDIFPVDDVNNPLEVQNPVTETSYKIVDTTEEARDLLDVSAGFSLNVKSGMFKAGASGAYLTDTFNHQNTVEVAIKATYQTVTETLRPKASPVNTWKQMKGLGTHYVRSVTYGGELIASIRMVCNNTKDKKNIKAGLEVGGRIKVFDVGVEVEGEYLSDVSKSIDSMQIKVFSSVPLQKIPKDMQGLEEMMKKFPETMKKYNNGKGVPIKVELWPLELLDSSRPKYISNKVLEAHLESFEEKFDDLLNTKAAVNDWMKSIIDHLPKEHEEEIGEFYGRIVATLRPFYDVIGKLDLSLGINQLTPALEKYGKTIPGVFYRQYQQLRQKLMDDQGEWFRERGSGVTYSHWGKSNCTWPAETIFSGHSAGSNGYGGGANFLCLSKEPGNIAVNFEYETKGSLIQGVSYKFPNLPMSELMCCSCRLPTRGSLQMFVGMSKCPKDWIQIYHGFLTSGLADEGYSDFVCLDSDAETAEALNKNSPLVVNWATASEDSISKIFPCSVCAK